MKKQLIPLVGVLGLLLFAGSAFAQNRVVRADIPFDFQVNGHTMPAGTYIVGRTLSNAPTLIVQNTNTKAVALVMTNSVQSAKPAEKTKLVFRVNGDRYSLYRIWVAGQESGREVPKSKMETKVAEERHAPDVYVAASLQ